MPFMRVLVVYYRRKSTFIQRDVDIFSKHFDVDEISIRKVIDIFPLIKKIRKSDVVYIWFAGKHAGISVLLAKLIGKKSIVVVGGYDVAKVPEINYGLWAVGSFWDKLLAKLALNYSDAVVSVSGVLAKNLRIYANIKRNIYVVPTGYDSNFWEKGFKDKENIVLTVAYVNRVERIKVKGLDIFLKIAKNFPETTFRVVGIEKNVQGKIKEYVKSDNVEILPPLPPSKLLTHYQKAKVFSLLSRSEGLPNTLCEAMLCECIPVVTNVGEMPEVVDNYGFVVSHSEDDIYNVMKKALETSPELGKKARERIIKLYSLKKREKIMLKIIKRITSEGEKVG